VILSLEMVTVPVADVDHATAFYADRLGFHLDMDVRRGRPALCPPHPAGIGVLHRDGRGLD
jgi:catechol 2,3-dioxygenase-like lactoylglutathione lyase family enzyme